MKNLIVNIFKTLFFFDLSVIVFTLLPVIEKKNEALTKLISEAMVLGVLLILTAFYILFIEKRKIMLPIPKKPLKPLLVGLGVGVAIPVVIVILLKILKHFQYISFVKTTHYHYWILALLCNAVATELLYRGYLFTIYRKFHGFTFAALVTTALYFSANFEIFSKDKILIANIVMFNLLLCFLLEYSNSIITTIAARFAYTLISTFALGSYPLSGGYPVLINHTFSPSKFFVGSEYPLESSKLMLVILSLLTLIFIFQKYKPITQAKKLIVYVKSIPQRIRARKFRNSIRPKKVKARR